MPKAAEYHARAIEHYRLAQTCSAEYHARAIEHYRLAQTCLSDEARQIHHRIAESFVALANTEAVRVPQSGIS
jgi:hypothetical protein